MKEFKVGDKVKIIKDQEYTLVFSGKVFKFNLKNQKCKIKSIGPRLIDVRFLKNGQEVVVCVEHNEIINLKNDKESLVVLDLGSGAMEIERQLIIKLKIVLIGNGSNGTSFLFHLHAFLGLDSLVQTF